jgi:uncharacterized pyridoxamine 5'-phosphate oxidase family protein
MKNMTAFAGVICVFTLSLTACGSTQKAADPVPSGQEAAPAPQRVTEPVYSGEKNVSEYQTVLEQNPNGVLANRNGSQLRTQIMSFQFIEGNNVYFCTGSEKPLYEQLLQFPDVSYCTYPEDFEPVLSLNGKAVFTDDKALKDRVFSGEGYASQFIKNHYQSPDNPNLRLFYLAVDEIETYDSEGAKVYKTF